MKRAAPVAAVVILVAFAGFFAWRTLRPRALPETFVTDGSLQTATLLPPAAPPIPETPGVNHSPPAAPGMAVAPDRVSSLLAQFEQSLRTDNAAWREEILTQLLPSLLAQDPAAAVLLLENVPKGPLRTQLLRHLARAWAAVDFEAAVAWIASLPDATEQKTAFTDACFEVAQSKAAAAIQAWESLAFPPDDHVLENLVQNWAEQDMTAAVAWTVHTAPGPRRDQAVSRIAYVMARTRPREAAAFVTRELPPGPEQTEAAISVLHQWAASDRAAAAAWVEHFPPGPMAERAQSELAGMAAHPPSRTGK